MPVLIATDLTSRSDRVMARCLLLKRPVILAHVAGGQDDISDELIARLENIAREDLPDADPVPEIVILKGQVGRVRQGGVISAVAVGHRQAALAVMCRG